MKVPEFQNLDELSGQEFESLIIALLIAMGFQAEPTAVSGDGGIDIVATLDRPFSGGRYIFQCKRYAENNLVVSRRSAIFCGAVVDDRAVKGIFVFTSGFTRNQRNSLLEQG